MNRDQRFHFGSTSVRRALVIASTMASLPACGGSSEPAAPPTSQNATIARIDVTLQAETLYAGTKTSAQATAKSSSGTTLSAQNLRWVSSDTNVATINSAGVVQARAAGLAQIQASSAGITGSASVTVSYAPIVRIDLVLDSVLTVDRVYPVRLVVTDSVGLMRTDVHPRLSASDTTRLQVLGDSAVRVLRPGTSSVAATLDGRSWSQTLPLVLDSAKYLDSRVFSSLEYRRVSSDLAADTPESVLRRHWLQFGAAEGRVAHPNVSMPDYLALNPAVALAVANDPARALRQFIDSGIAVGSPAKRSVSPAMPLLQQPTISEYVDKQPTLSIFSLGRSAHSGTASDELSRVTGLVVPNPRDGRQWQIAGATAVGTQLPGIVQQYNGWFGVSLDSRSIKAAWEAYAPPDTPALVNYNVPCLAPYSACPKPYAARGLFADVELQIPTAGSASNGAAYVNIYFLLRDITTGQFIWVGTYVYDTRGSILNQSYVQYDNCAQCTGYVIAASQLGGTLNWHTKTPGSLSYTGAPFRELRHVAFTISGDEFLRRIAAVKAQFPALSTMSSNPADYELRNFNIDVELGGRQYGDAWIAMSARVLGAGVSP